MVYPDIPMPIDEQGCQRNLERYGVLDAGEDEHLQRLVRLAARVMETPTALISLVDNNRQWFLARYGMTAKQTPRQMAFCAHAICSEEPLVVPDAQQDPRFSTNPLVTDDPAIRFYAGTVLQSPEGHNLGTLCVVDQVPRRLSRFQVETLQDLGQLVMREMELRRKATRCSTTGATLRTQFMEQAQRELQRGQQQGVPMALLLVDIDNFSLINQHWGHEAGDRVLASVVTFLQSNLQASDLLGRLGDEEFAMLLVNVELEDALLRAEQLRSGISELPGSFNSHGHQLHLSGGLTLLNKNDTTMAMPLRRAEQALLLAQGNGHNQIAEVLGG